MSGALHLRVARPRLKPQDKLGFWEILMFSQIVAHLDENIVSNCRNVCVFANDVRQSPLFYLVQHSPSEWPNNNDKDLLKHFSQRQNTLYPAQQCDDRRTDLRPSGIWTEQKVLQVGQRWVGTWPPIMQAKVGPTMPPRSKSRRRRSRRKRRSRRSPIWNSQCGKWGGAVRFFWPFPNLEAFLGSQNIIWILGERRWIWNCTNLLGKH